MKKLVSSLVLATSLLTSFAAHANEMPKPPREATEEEQVRSVDETLFDIILIQINVNWLF